jgi:cell division protein FtsI (penicillin-binding protein 3)/stage V sporulation protein D (sporulation-specific penicillin-binding protein)
VLVDDAKIGSNLNYGGLVAAPVFSRIAEKAARYLDLTPTQPPVALQTSPLAQSNIQEYRP